MDNVGLTTSERTGRQCGCDKNSDANRLIKWTTAGGLLAALGVCAACCLLPFALLSVGVAGAWVTTLDRFAAYKWIFISLTATLLAYGFYAAYLRPKRASVAGADCGACDSSRTVRIGLWVATVLAISGIVFEHLEPMLTK